MLSMNWVTKIPMHQSAQKSTKCVFLRDFKWIGVLKLKTLGITAVGW